MPAHAVALKDPDEAIRRFAAGALRDIGRFAAEVVPTLVVALRDPDNSVRWRAAAALKEIKAPAVSALAAALKDRNQSVRWFVAQALGEIGPAAAEAVAALAAALKDPDESIRRRVALALGKIGPAAAEAVAALATPLKEDPALKGSAQSVRRILAQALERSSQPPPRPYVSLEVEALRVLQVRCGRPGPLPGQARTGGSCKPEGHPVSVWRDRQVNRNGK